MGNVTIASSTESQASLNEAAGLPLDHEAQEMENERAEHGNGFPRKFLKSIETQRERVSELYERVREFDPEAEQPEALAMPLHLERRPSGNEANRIIAKLVKTRHALANKLEVYEKVARRDGMTPAQLENDDRREKYTATLPESHEAEPETPAEERETPVEDSPAKAEIRARFADFDEVAERGKREHWQIPATAADALAALPEQTRLAIQYALGKSAAARADLLAVGQKNPALAAEHIRLMAERVEAVHSGAARPGPEATAHNQRMEKLKAEDPAGFEALSKSKMRLEGGIGDAVVAQPNSEKVAVYLAQHPEKVDELNAIPNPVARAAAVGRLSGELERSRVFVSKAPAPIPALRGFGTKSSLPLDQLPMDEYNRERDKMQRGRVRK